MHTPPTQAARRTLFTLVLLALIGVALLAWPLWKALFFGAVLAGALFPAATWLQQRLWNRRGPAALLFTLGTAALVLGPLVAFGAWTVSEGQQVSQSVREAVSGAGVMGLVDALPDGPRELVHSAIGGLSLDGAALDQKLADSRGRAATAVGGVLSATGALAVQFAMMLVTLFALLLEGAAFIGYLEQVSPLPRGQLHELLAEFRKTAVAVLLSTGATAAAQAGAALVGYLIARVPHPVFFTALTFFIAFLPSVGAASVCLVAALLLLATGHTGMAIFLGVWGVLVVGLIDNVLKPLLAKRGLDLNGYVVLLALVGGLATFGAPGLLLGPLLVAFFMAVMRIWGRDYQEKAGPVG